MGRYDWIVTSRNCLTTLAKDLTWSIGETQAVKRKKPVSKSTLGEEAAKFLEMALAVDHTVIKFHGKQRVQQYVLTLLNIVSPSTVRHFVLVVITPASAWLLQVSAIYEDTSLEANLRLVVSRLIFYEDRKQGQVPYTIGNRFFCLHSKIALILRCERETPNALWRTSTPGMLGSCEVRLLNGRTTLLCGSPAMIWADRRAMHP